MNFKLFLLFYMFLLLSGKAQEPTYSLSPDKKLSQYNIDRWSTENGLPTNSLLYVYQSSNGYLWITGYAGLIRYNGHEFKVFNNANTDVLNSNVIRNIRGDDQGRLWITTLENGLIMYDNGRFEVFGENQGIVHLYRGLLADSQGRIWAASPDHGWFYYKDGVFNFIDFSSPLKHIEVRAIAEDRKGSIWFATMGEGLYRYSDGELTRFDAKDGLDNEWIYSLFFDMEDHLWLGTAQGIYHFDGKRFVREMPEITSTISEMLTDRYGNLWVGSFDGIFRINMQSRQLEHITAVNGLANNFITDMEFDAEGSLWISHYKGGLSRIKDGKFTNLTSKGGMPGKVVNTVYETKKKEILVGFDNGKLACISNNKIREVYLPQQLVDVRIRHVAVDEEQSKWLSTYSGLMIIKADGSSEMLNEANGFIGTKIRLTFHDSRGNVWVGTRNNGLGIIRPDGSIDQLSVDDGLSSNLVMAIDEDREGNIWVGTSEGEGALNRIDSLGNIKVFGKENGFKSDVVFNISCDREGNVWLATVDGLWLFRDQQFYNATTRNGLFDNSIYDIVEDDHGHLWMPFARGIMKVEKSDLFTLFNKASDSVHCRVFDQYDGMAVSECNSTAQALKGKNGLLYFPTLDGLSIIDPGDTLVNNYLTPVVIERLEVDNRPLALEQNQEFSPEHRRYTFHFAGLSLYEPEKVRFQYRLEGFDDSWNTSTAHSVSYTNLPGGQYTFTVKASNNDGVWNEQEASLSFSIKPRFVETTLFYILLLIVSFVSIFVIYTLRVSQYKQKQSDLELAIGIRTREVLEKNQELENQKSEIQNQNRILQKQKDEIEEQALRLAAHQTELKETILTKDKILSVISHDLRSPLGNVMNMLDLLSEHGDDYNSEKQKRIIADLSKTTRSSFYLLDNLLTWSRSQRGVIPFEPRMLLALPVIDEIIRFLSDHSQKKNIRVQCTVDESVLVYGDENMVKAIFRNLLDNAIKFTPPGGSIEISQTTEGEYIRFCFRDNGVGMSKESISRLLENDEIKATFGTQREKGSGLGLLLVKEFVLKNKGKFSIESVPGQGSSFYVHLKRFQL